MKDLNLLYAFEALWLHRSVTAAAEELGVSQAAASGALKRLRTQYNDKLFVLVGRRMEPTPRAVEVAASVLDALGLIRQTQLEVARFEPASVKRSFTIRTRDISEAACFPQIVATLAKIAPSIRLRTVSLTAEETIQGLAAGRVDLALGFLPTLETDIHRQVVCKQRYVCAMRVGHPLENIELTPALFHASDHLLVEHLGGGHVLLERTLEGAGARDRIKMRIPQYLSAPYFIIDSDMLWSVPHMLAQTISRNFPIRIKPHPLQLADFDLALYWHDRFHRDPANQWLRQFIGLELAKITSSLPQDLPH